MCEDLRPLVERALACVPDGGRVGLGSGHTAEAFLEGLAERVRQGLHVEGVPTSEAAGQLAVSLGIPLGLLGRDPLDLTVDGADEVEVPGLNLLKGWGGALARERIVAAASFRQVILVTSGKLVPRLGTRGKLPVEVLPFAVAYCQRRIEDLPGVGGLRPALRKADDGPFVTDNGNWILDCALGPQDAPAVLEGWLRAIPGVVDTGLFLGTADVVFVSEGGAVRELRRS